jgi:hypothetical protein
LEDLLAEVRAPKCLIWITAGDHFFRGALQELEEEVFRLPAEGCGETAGWHAR